MIYSGISYASDRKTVTHLLDQVFLPSDLILNLLGSGLLHLQSMSNLLSLSFHLFLDGRHVIIQILLVVSQFANVSLLSGKAEVVINFIVSQAKGPLHLGQINAVNYASLWPLTCK